MNRLIILLFALLMLTTTGCNPHEKTAKDRLLLAKTLYEQQNFPAAQSEIDSIRILYPTDVKTRKQALILMKQVQLAEAERNIALCDSLLPIRQQEAQAAAQNFIIETDSAYQKTAHYIPKQQTIERNIERCYIRCTVSQNSEIHLTSIYFGHQPIHHTGLKLSIADTLFAQTPAVPYDSANNYRFTDNSNTSEIIHYKHTNAIDAIRFVYNHTNERIKADYTGGKPYAIYLTDDDKQAIANTYKLSLILSDLAQLTEQKQKSLQKIAHLQHLSLALK